MVSHKRSHLTKNAIKSPTVVWQKKVKNCHIVVFVFDIISNLKEEENSLKMPQFVMR